jgi:uncharacterized protein YciI
MLYLRMCFDSAGKDDLRNETRAEQRAYLVPFLAPGQDVHIVQAGPMCVSDTSDQNLGSFFILEAPSMKAVEDFHAGDLFTKKGVFGNATLVRWDRHIDSSSESQAAFAAQNARPAG